MNDVEVRRACDALCAGGVIAYPTEAVFGLGCDPANETALQRIIDMKGRDAHKGFILVASSQHQLAPWLATVEPAWQAQFDSAWPGPVTFVVPAARVVSELLTGSRPTIAVRVSDHPVVQALCHRYGSAIVSTSANVSGQLPCLTAGEVAKTFDGQVDVIVSGATGRLSSPTRILDICTGAQLR